MQPTTPPRNQPLTLKSPRPGDPVDAAVSIDLPFAEGLAPGTHHTVSPGSIEVCGMRWQLS